MFLGEIRVSLLLDDFLYETVGDERAAYSGQTQNYFTTVIETEMATKEMIPTASEVAAK